MLKSKLFKSLVVAGLITAISVPVFAAGQTEQVQPTMRDKVEKILSEGDTDARRPMPLRRGLHCGWGPGYGRHHGEGRYDRDRHYDRYHHDGHCDWGDECPFYNEDK